MTNLEKLRELNKQLIADGMIDVKFTAGSNAEASLEDAAGDALILLQGTDDGEDITEQTF